MDPLERFRDRLDSILSIESRNGLRQCTKETLTEGDLTHVANLLKNGAKKADWAKRPRLFAILYIIGCMQDTSTMDQFVQLGYRDIDLPFREPLPPPLKSHKARMSFKENQKKIFTGVGDLEKGMGHQSFEDGDKYYSEGRQLGIGSYAYVYEVFSQQSFENFARKMFQKPRRHDEALRISKAVADEVEHLKGLSHRHLIKFVGSYTDMKYIAILTQPVARCNLMEFLSQSPLSAEDESRLPCYFGCLANALQYLHAMGIKHKDLKPGNILVSSEGRVLITDFGSATSFWETGQSTTMGPEFTMTVDYAPREVMESKPRNTKVDVYSLGAVFFEMWTVWKGETISNMKLYFSKNGSNGGNIRTNPIAVAEWSEQLTSLPGHLYKNEPIKYIRRMIQDDPKARPDMDEIVLETVGSGQTSRFCCPECMSEYSDDGIFRRFHATAATVTIPRSNTTVPEIATQQSIAELNLTIARPKSETTNPPGTAESGITTAIPISHPSGTKIMTPRIDTLSLEERFRAMDPNVETATPSATAESSLDTALSDSNSTTSKTLSPVQPAGTPEPVSKKDIKSDNPHSAERDVTESFKVFAAKQRENINQARVQRLRVEKEMKLNELKKFADSFKLHTPVPSDLVNLIAKDPSKQKEIQERAKRNAEKFLLENFKVESDLVTKPDTVSTPLPHVTEVPNRAWLMPSEFDWTEMEMLNLVRLKKLKSQKEFRKDIITEFPQRSGTNVKKFWIAFCQVNNLRAAV